MGMLNDFEAKLESANRKLDVLIAKIDSLLGTAPLADSVEDEPVAPPPAPVYEGVGHSWETYPAAPGEIDRVHT
jgi:hypothetical protein